MSYTAVEKQRNSEEQTRNSTESAEFRKNPPLFGFWESPLNSLPIPTAVGRNKSISKKSMEFRTDVFLLK